MCTAISYKTKDHYFGRNLDYEFSYDETVTFTPRNFPFNFRNGEKHPTHYAMTGMAFVQQNYPLYYDATNEKGLSVAGLNFPQNACYKPFCDGKTNVAPFEFIPWVLCDCATVDEAKEKLANANLWAENFSDKLPASPLHWIISDSEKSITVEPLSGGLVVYDNPVGVLTNNPTFDFHMTNLCNYMALSRNDPECKFAEGIDLAPYSRGMGGIGLPGDLSSASRFVKAAFTKLNSICPEGDEESSVSQFFHILGSVEQQKGCCRVKGGFEYTIYSSCCNTDKGIYYYTTYGNSRVNAVDSRNEDYGGCALVSYPLKTAADFSLQNPKK